MVMDEGKQWESGRQLRKVKVGKSQKARNSLMRTAFSLPLLVYKSHKII